MKNISYSISLDVPLEVAYAQWTHYEEFPSFMANVQAVQKMDDDTVRFVSEILGVRREFIAKTTKQRKNEFIQWESVDEPKNQGSVSFRAINEAASKIQLDLQWEPEGFVEQAGSWIGVDGAALHTDLIDFKHHVEKSYFAEEHALSDVDEEERSNSVALLTDFTEEMKSNEIDSDLQQPDGEAER